ncbi:MAG: restriction endonuclease subunit S [Prevotella sp.]|nr:restriction endonuclease subunit S [Prevotella sp.]
MELKQYKLSEVAKVEISSVDKKSKENETQVRLCNFTDVYYNWAITRQMEESLMVATANIKEIERFILKKGQVALTKDSETKFDIGISTYIADDFEDVILGYHCALITPDESKLNGKYLNAFMHSKYIQKYFENSASGSGQRYTLSLETLESMPLLLPSLEEQKKIGEIFSSLDKKIALNHAINQNLEALAKQLYDYWFVQFDFPNEEGKPYKSSGGKMVWNEKLKRETPENWAVLPLFEAVNVQYGFPFATEQFTEQETPIPVVRIRDILDGTTSAYSLEDTDEKYNLNEGDVVVGMDGNFHMNYWHDNKAYLNQRCVRLRPLVGSNLSSIQIFHSIKPYIKAKEMNAKGSTVGHLSDKDLKELFILQATMSESFKPRQTFDVLLKQMIANKQETLSLAKQRDELLPLLMNGQVTIK